MVAAEGEQHVGEVDAGSTDRHFDLAVLRRLAVSGDELEGVQITRGTDVQPHTVALGVDRGGSSFLRAQWAVSQARGVPRTLPPRRLVLVGAAQQFNGDRVGLGVGIDIDLGGS